MRKYEIRRTTEGWAACMLHPDREEIEWAGEGEDPFTLAEELAREDVEAGVSAQVAFFPNTAKPKHTDPF